MSILKRFTAFLILIMLPISAEAATRTALVIGNGAYADAPLRNPVNDAADMAAMLKELGFEVIVRTDADKRSMLEALDAFNHQLKQSDAGLFYFAGHGMQIRGANYLIPVGVHIRRERDVEYESVHAGRILAAMEDAGSKVNIVILDACRDNPFKRQFRSSSQGLGMMQGSRGSIIAYATSPGSVAADGEGRNGIYTRHLLANLDNPGVTVEEAFKQVRVGVVAETGGAQVPWESSSLMGSFYFAGGSTVIAQPQTAPGSSLEVRTHPAGAQIGIDGQHRGKSPLKLADLPPGTYRVAAVLPGFHVEEKTITVAGNTAAVVTLHLDAEKKTEPAPDPAKRTWTEPVTGMEFVWVPGGCYKMGCGSWSNHCDDDEKPVHEVCIDGFWMGKYEVTQGQWQKVMGSNPSHFKKGDDWPVETVSWDDAQRFIEKLNARNNDQYKIGLPTEAQWEYAARSGGREEKYAGGSDIDRLSWYGSYSGGREVMYAGGSDRVAWNSGKTTHRVGTKAPNGLGLYDMSGNVWEWCRDVYDESAYSKPSRSNPVVLSGGSRHVYRGGSWSDDPEFVRTTDRDGSNLGNRYSSLGFRLSRTP